MLVLTLVLTPVLMLAPRTGEQLRILSAVCVLVGASLRLCGREPCMLDAGGGLVQWKLFGGVDARHGAASLTCKLYRLP